MSAWNFLSPGQLVAGPRRVMVTPDRPQGYVICDQPPPHVPPPPERYGEEKGGNPSHPIVQVADWLDQAMRKRPGEPA